MRSNKKYMWLFTVAPTVLWIFAAWLISDRYYESSANKLVREQSLVAEQRARDLAGSIRRNLHFLDGIPEMLSHYSGVQAAVARFTIGSVPTQLPYEVRKQRWSQDPSLKELSRFLALSQKSLNVDIIYIVNAAGDCIAASNFDQTGSTIGANFAERDFFLSNKLGRHGMQYAMGKTTHIPGLFFSSPIVVNGQFMGAAVAKVDVQKLSFITEQFDAYITDKNGVIILAHDKPFEMMMLPDAAASKMSRQEKTARYQRQQFQQLALHPLGDKDFPQLYTIAGESVPHLRSSSQVQEFGLVGYAENDLPELLSLQRERLLVFMLTSLFGISLIALGSGTYSYMRTIKKSKAHLQENEAKLRGFYELSPLGIALTDMQGKYLEFNNAFRTICGYSAEELNTLDYWKLTPKEYEPMEAKQLESLRNTGFYGPYEKEYIRKDGTRIPIRLNGMLVRGNDDPSYIWSIVEDITEKRQVDKLIWRQANHDALTGLPNRRLLQDRLSQALAASSRSKKTGALLFLDLDNFKSLNDTLGHDMGDLLLQQVATRLIGCVREGDTVARLGGDEFVVLLEDLDPEPINAATQSESVCEKIIAAINQPYQLERHQHHCTSSIGITLFKEHQSIDELMKQADIAMYQSKMSGRNNLHFFDQRMQDTINARAALESQLRKALEIGQFHLYYQVKMDSSRDPFGAEALIRWQHPEKGIVSPIDFIALAEETGLIMPIGQWVLDRACAQLSKWQKNPHTSKLILSINVSARQFRSEDFVSEVQAAIERHSVNPALLSLELTESMLIENIENTIAKMSALKNIGVQIALDDFGTGYSSLQYLKRLPLSKLKIDKSFVNDIVVDSNDQAIVRTIISMAHSLDLAVVAEGVETEAQLQLLKELGCTHFQGYLFGKPSPIKQFEAMLQ